MTERVEGDEALWEFCDAQEQGHLPAAVPYVDTNDGTGWYAAGVLMEPDGKMAELALSENPDDRARAACIACLEVALATERAHESLHCVHPPTRVRRRRMFLSHSAVGSSTWVRPVNDVPPEASLALFVRHSIGRKSPP